MKCIWADIWSDDNHTYAESELDRLAQLNIGINLYEWRLQFQFTILNTLREIGEDGETEDMFKNI